MNTDQIFLTVCGVLSVAVAAYYVTTNQPAMAVMFALAALLSAFCLYTGGEE